MANTPTPTPSPSASYAFANLSPTATSNTQGDMPWYAKPGPSNIVYGATYASSLAAGGTPDVVGWSYSKPTAGLFRGLSHTIGTSLQGGLTYYALPGFLEQWSQLDVNQRTAIQKQLLASGMYGFDQAYYSSASGGPPSKKPIYGAAADIDTVRALTNAWDAAKSTGQTIDTVLSQANAAAMNAARIFQQNTMVGQFDQSDPAEIRGLADQQAVNVLGRKATADEKLLAVSMVQAAQVAYQQSKFNQNVAANRSDVAVQLAGGITGAGGTTAGVPGNASATANALVSALGGQETSSPTAGGYAAVNPDSGAKGRFQFMDFPAWAAEAGLGKDAPMTPQNQEIVALFKINQYLKNGNGDPAYVAVAWYGGERTAKAFQADPTNPKWKVPQYSNGKKYPSIYDYATSIAGKVGAAVPGTLATQAVAGQVGPAPTPPSGALAGETGSINVGQGAPASLAGEVGSINVGQRPGTIPSGGSSLGGEAGSIGVGPGIPGGTGLTGSNAMASPQVSSANGLPTPAQLIPTSTGVYTQVNPTADVAEMLRNRNPQGAGAHDLAQILDAVHALFHGGAA